MIIAKKFQFQYVKKYQTNIILRQDKILDYMQKKNNEKNNTPFIYLQTEYCLHGYSNSMKVSELYDLFKY